MALESLNKITLDVSTPLNIPVVRAVQEDIRSRYVEITLVSNGEPLVLPEGVTAIVGLRRANDTYVLYDTDEDNNPAVTFDGNKATVYLRQEAVAMAGSMYTTVTIFNGTSKKLSAFAFTLKVDQTAVPADVIVESDYINIFQEELDEINTLLDNLSATATTLPAGSDATASYSDGVFSFGIPKGDPGDLSRADLETKAPVITDTASGFVASTIDSAGGMWAKSLVVNIEPIQAGSGDPSPDNVRPISGRTGLTAYRTGINLLGGNALRDAVKTSMPGATINDEDKYIQFSAGAATSMSISDAAGMVFKPNTQYTFILSLYKTSGAGSNLKVYYTDGTNSNIPNLSAATTKETIVFTSDSGKTIEKFSKNNSSGSTRVYYDESGIFEGVLTTDDYESYAGTSYPVTWQSEAGTVYGGTVDVVTGVLTVTHWMVDLSAQNWNTRYTGNTNKTLSTALSIRFDRNRPIADTEIKAEQYVAVATVSGASALSNPDNKAVGIYRYYQSTAGLDGTIYMVIPNADTPSGKMTYKIATPQTYQLTPTEVEMLLGVNNVFSDGGSVTLEYPCDTKLYIERLTQPTDEDMIANANIPAHQYFMVGNSLYYSTAAIAQDADILVGTNCTRLSLADALNALNS